MSDLSPVALGIYLLYEGRHHLTRGGVWGQYIHNTAPMRSIS